MRAFLLPFLTLPFVQTAAQEVRTTMLNDSVRQVEIVNEKDKVIARHYFIGERPVGILQDFDHKGKLTERDFGKLRYGSPPLSEGIHAEVVVDNAPNEVSPEFPGGDAGKAMFLARTLIYPAEAMDAGIMGEVIVEGTVDETGDWHTVAINRSADPYLDYEAWRVCELMPNWSPGTLDGKPVKVAIRLPVRFLLE